MIEGRDQRESENRTKSVLATVASGKPLKPSLEVHDINVHDQSWKPTNSTYCLTATYDGLRYYSWISSNKDELKGVRETFVNLALARAAKHINSQIGRKTAN
jgi:hypothetical protein